MVPLWLPTWVRGWGENSWGFGSREQSWGVGCRARVALAVQDAHEMGSTALASLHLAVLPQHLCNELIRDRNGDRSCTERELSSSEPPPAVGPC